MLVLWTGTYVVGDRIFNHSLSNQGRVYVQVPHAHTHTYVHTHTHTHTYNGTFPCTSSMLLCPHPSPAHATTIAE